MCPQKVPASLRIYLIADARRRALAKECKQMKNREASTHTEPFHGNRISEIKNPKSVLNEYENKKVWVANERSSS